MPWAKMTYDRAMTVYKDALAGNVIFQKKNEELVLKELLIRTEILKHNFTKRQLSIISIILTLTFPFGKVEALIPKLKDFELAGISKHKVGSELRALEEMNVIEWNKVENTFSIVEPRFWSNVPYNAGYNDPRSQEIFILNLKHAGVDVNPIIEKLNKAKE